MSISVFNRSKEDDGGDDELALGTPDMAEAQSLERHVDRCAMRYRLFTRRMTAQGKSLNRVERLGYAIAALVILTNPKIWEVIGAIEAFVKP